MDWILETLKGVWKYNLYIGNYAFGNKEMLIKIMQIRVSVHFGLGCILVWGAIRVGVRLRLG